MDPKRGRIRTFGNGSTVKLSINGWLVNSSEIDRRADILITHLLATIKPQMDDPATGRWHEVLKTAIALRSEQPWG